LRNNLLYDRIYGTKERPYEFLREEKRNFDLLDPLFELKTENMLKIEKFLSKSTFCFFAFTTFFLGCFQTSGHFLGILLLVNWCQNPAPRTAG
jgi:hypothetical protein